VVQGGLPSGRPQVYTVRANAGDIIFGTCKLQGVNLDTTVTLALYDKAGSKLKEQSCSGDFGETPQEIGFSAPAAGAYSIRITAAGDAAGSYTLSTKRQTPAERTAGVAVNPAVRFKSPRVEQLAKDVSARQAGAVERFWSEAKARGGPLVETMEGNDRDFLVTFLWRQTYDTRNVLVIWAGAAPRDYYMSRVPRTNVWYKTLRLRRGSRFSYLLAPNDRMGEPHYTAQIDPLNPRIAYGTSSILETPGAPDESWYSRKPAISGLITPHAVDSALLKKQRSISVYTPPGYSPSSGPYPLLILFDGRAYATGNLQASNTLDNLIADHRIRPTVVCFVNDNRSVSVNPDQRPAYASAMATELVPWIRAMYAVSTNPKEVVIGGFSAGGGMAGYVAFNYPEVFGNVLLQSGGAQVMVPLLLNAPKLPVRFYVDQGLYEYGFTWAALSPDEQAVDGWFGEDLPQQGQNWLLRARLLRDILQAKGYDFTYHETGGAHEGLHWRATLAEGLIALLGQSAN